MRRLSLLAFLIGVFSPPLAADPVLPGLPTDEASRELVQRWRDRQIWLAQTETQFAGVVQSGSTLMDLGKVGFILEQIGGRARRFLHRDDHDRIFDAVEGQSAAEIERNLPAIVTYAQLSTAAQLYWRLAKQNKPPFGSRRGLTQVRDIAKSVYDFRNEQVDRVRRGRVDPARVLTAQNLGELGEPRTLENLRGAYRAGHEQFVGRRNMVVLLVPAFELCLGLVIAFAVLRRTRGFLLLPALRT